MKYNHITINQYYYKRQVTEHRSITPVPINMQIHRQTLA